MSLAAALATLASLPQVQRAEQRVREATTQLRWHEGLRRRWNEARAENAVRTAVGVAALAGARVPASLLRAEVARSAGIVTARQAPSPETQRAEPAGPALDAGGGAVPADFAIALGAWHAAADVVSHFPPLSGRPGRAQAPPAPALLAGWHRSLTSTRTGSDLAPAGVDPAWAGARSLPGIPVSPQHAALVADVLSGAGQGTGANVLVRCAIVQAELATGAAFPVAGAELGVLAGWYVAVLGGLDPTGVAHPGALAVSEPAQYRSALAAYATGSPDGVVQWVEFVARSWEEGALIGRAVCDSVLAGRTVG
ncbi:hypothetical protein [Buchananella felis]|uniref:hypothetical protein n=1 Tax=Buchananella felis TaxID=3231492 RepID=UPI00352878E0